MYRVINFDKLRLVIALEITGLTPCDDNIAQFHHGLIGFAADQCLIHFVLFGRCGPFKLLEKHLWRFVISPSCAMLVLSQRLT